MPLSARSRDSGIEFAVGWFLFALGIGVFIPRKGLGLYSLLHSGPGGWLWGALMVAVASLLIVASFSHHRGLHLAAIGLGMTAWSALAFLFVEASLWGASLQALLGVVLLNSCFFNLWRQT